MKHLKLIKAAIQSKRVTNSQYSNNALARDIGVSGAFLSNILNGKKDIPLDVLVSLLERLNFDDFTKNEFLKFFLMHKYSGTLFEQYLGALNPLEQHNFLPLVTPTSSILKKWYYLAILEYFSCDSYTENLEKIAHRFALTDNEVLETFFVLEKAKVIEKDAEGRFKKCERYIRIPTNEPVVYIREFHNQMIEEAQKNLMQKISTEDFQKRLITGITVAVNPKNIEQCKRIIEEALHQVSLQLSEGECSEVYQMNMQLFPLTN